MFVQVIMRWLIDAAMVCNDVKLRAYGIQPLTVSNWALNNKFMHWYISVAGVEILEPHITFKTRIQRFIEGIIKALFLCMPVFLIWWPVAVAIMVGVGRSIGGGNYSYNHWPVYCLWLYEALNVLHALWALTASDKILVRMHAAASNVVVGVDQYM